MFLYFIIRKVENFLPSWGGTRRSTLSFPSYGQTYHTTNKYKKISHNMCRNPQAILIEKKTLVENDKFLNMKNMDSSFISN